MSKEKCCVQGCLMSRRNNSSLFAFPNNPASKQIWKNTLTITKSTDVSKLFVCSRHFDKTAIKETKTKRTLMRLKSFSVPTLNLPFNFERPTIEFVDEKMVIDTETFSDPAERDPFEIISPEASRREERVVIKKPNKSKRRCIVPSCTGSKGINHISLHKFPENKEKLLNWKSKLNIMHLRVEKNSRVCSNHFHVTDFFLPKCPQSVKILKKDVVPTLTPEMNNDGSSSRNQLQ